MNDVISIGQLFTDENKEAIFEYYSEHGFHKTVEILEEQGIDKRIVKAVLRQLERKTFFTRSTK